jgi:hypothetical protein
VIHPCLFWGFLERNRARIQARPTGSQAATHFAARYSIYPERSGASEEWDKGTAAGLSVSAPLETPSKHPRGGSKPPGRFQPTTRPDGRSGTSEAATAGGDGLLLLLILDSGGGAGGAQPAGGADRPHQVAGGRPADVAGEAAHPRGGRRVHGARSGAGRRARRPHGHARTRRRVGASHAAAAAWGRPQGYGLLQAGAGPPLFPLSRVAPFAGTLAMYFLCSPSYVCKMDI